MSGSKKIEQQLREIGSFMHVYGHTHIDNNFTKDGVNYVQISRKYPREQKLAPDRPSGFHKHKFEDMMVWKCELAKETASSLSNEDAVKSLNNSGSCRLDLFVLDEGENISRSQPGTLTEC